jgi:hypothetical protein
MAQAKTRQTKASVAAFLAAIDDPVRRKDCETIAALMQDATGAKPKMWGTSIVGFGSYHYRYASGHEGDSCLTGFSPRKDALTLYLMLGGLDGHSELLKALGKHKASKGCLYIKRLEDVDLGVLRKLVNAAVARLKKAHPSG